eukprot:gene20855-14578_t
MGWTRVALDGWHGGAYCAGDPPAPGACPRGVTSLAECKARCIASAHPYMCMGKGNFKGGGRGAAGTGAFHAGRFNETQTAAVTTLDGCKAACIADAACVQLTWAQRPKDPCVLYQTIYAQMETVPGAVGWVKCAQGAKGPGCATVTPGGPSPSPTSPASAAAGRVQRDWVPAPPTPPAPPAAPGNGSAEWAAVTAFPHDNAVALRVSWADPAVRAVSVALRVRVPGWLTAPLPVLLNGAPLGTGTPG